MGRPANPHRDDVVRAILRGAPLKEIADAGRVQLSRAGKWARELGFKRFYVTDDERRALLEQRRKHWANQTT